MINLKNIISRTIMLLLFSFSLPSCNKFKKPKDNLLPNDFVYLKDIAPDIIQDVRYSTDENFVGCKIDGYLYNTIIIKKCVAEALAEANKFLNTKGYNLVIYDAYRPKRAVEHFIKWSNTNDNLMKENYYPNLQKSSLLKLGYISDTSTHCKGYTVDLSIIKKGQSLHKPIAIKRNLSDCVITFLDDGTVDMGTGFDFLHESSNHESKYINGQAADNRRFLKFVMIKYGFEPYQKEWWHYTYKKRNDNQDYDFIVK